MTWASLIAADDALGERGELLTAEGGPLRATPILREKLAIFKSGLCLVARNHAEDHDVISAIALARRLGHQIYPPQYVDLGAIRSVYSANQAASEEAEEDSADTAMKREFLDLLYEAAKRNASDVHIVVGRGEANVWFRTDGERKPYLERPWRAQFGHQLCRTGYAMADVAEASYEQFAYQGARISNGLPEGLQAVRLQFNPVGFDGRQLVMRLLYSKQSAGATLSGLGFSEHHIDKLDLVRSLPTGITVVCGPTGSGKSTTLERLLRLMVDEHPGDHILSVEDPPEYLIPGVVQLPVSNVRSDEDRDSAFSEAIAAALRSDPDRIMIGEVRTRASAQLAIRAALTGHAVYTTLHTNDALGVITRFMDIGIEPYLLCDPTTIRGMLAQRLVRRLCPYCKQPAGPDDLPGDMWDRLHAKGHSGEIFIGGPGCEQCKGGFKGRSVVAEIICPDQILLDLLTSGKRVEAEQRWLNELGGMTMLDHGLDKIFAGLADPREIEHKVGRFGG